MIKRLLHRLLWLLGERPPPEPVDRFRIRHDGEI